MDVFVVSVCVLSSRGLCDELITRPEKSYRLWCVVVCDLETSRMRRPWPAGPLKKILYGRNHPIIQFYISITEFPFHTVLKFVSQVTEANNDRRAFANAQPLLKLLKSFATKDATSDTTLQSTRPTTMIMTNYEPELFMQEIPHDITTRCNILLQKYLQLRILSRND